MNRLAILTLALLALSACKVTVIVPRGGEVLSAEAGDCAELTNCVEDINDSTYFASFTASPSPGFQFVEWNEGGNFLCKNLTELTCEVDTSAAAGIIPDAVIAALGDYYIMPIFSDRAPLPNTVMLAGKEWAQPTSFSAMPWDDINAVCPIDQGGVCTGSLQGYDLTGWTWATKEDIVQLLAFYDPTVPPCCWETESSHNSPAWTADIFPALKAVEYVVSGGRGDVIIREYDVWTAEEFDEIEAINVSIRTQEFEGDLSSLLYSGPTNNENQLRAFFFKSP